MLKRLLPLVLLAATACGEKMDPVQGGDKIEAEALFAMITAQDYQNNWTRPPMWASRLNSTAGTHQGPTDLFINDVMNTDSQTAGINAWTPQGPGSDGAIAIKDTYDGGTLKQVSIAQKRAGGFFFAEFTGGTFNRGGLQNETCNGCHSSPTADDHIFSVDFP